jgi:hypothetical protein
VVQNARQGQAGRRDRAMLTLQTDAGFEQSYGVFAKITLRICSLINIHGRKCGMLAAIQHVAAYADLSKEIHVSRLVGQTISDKRG